MGEKFASFPIFTSDKGGEDLDDDPFDPPAEEQRVMSAFQAQKGRSQSLSTFSKDSAQGFRLNQAEKEEVGIGVCYNVLKFATSPCSR